MSPDVIICPKCGLKIHTEKTVGLSDEKVVSCARCHEKFTLAAGRQQPQSPAPQQLAPPHVYVAQANRKPGFPWAVAIILGIALLAGAPFVLCCGIFGSAMGSIQEKAAQRQKEEDQLVAKMSPTERADYYALKSLKGQEFEAVFQAQKLIKKSLKSPSTAEFKYPTIATVGTKYMYVRGDVTAVNAFNAPLTQQYEVILLYENGKLVPIGGTLGTGAIYSDDSRLTKFGEYTEQLKAEKAAK